MKKLTTLFTIERTTKANYRVLTAPLTAKDKATNGWVKGVVAIDLSDFIDSGGLEGTLDLLSERLIGNECLMDIHYRVVGHEGNTLHVEVEGDASEALTEDDESA